MPAVASSTPRIKSGTNQFHGTLWEFFRNSALDATQWEPTQNAKKFPFKQNQFGAAAGGPIIKNKLFIFGDYQGFRSSAPASTDYATVPTDLMRSSGFTDFSELLSQGIRSRIRLPDSLSPATSSPSRSILRRWIT